MKKNALLFALPLLISASLFSQAPEKQLQDFLTQSGIQPTRVMLIGTFHFAHPNLDQHKIAKKNMRDILTPASQIELQQVLNVLRAYKPTRIYLEGIAKIVNNRIVKARSDYNLYASDKYFELYDDYNIPVLQIELYKATNTIYISGAFNSLYSYTIISKGEGINSWSWNSSKLLFPQARKDSLLDMYLKDAKAIKPIHER